MADYPQGGGGGPAPGGAGTSSDYALDKPYDVYGGWSPDMADQINEMFSQIYGAITKTAARIVAPVVATPVVAAALTATTTVVSTAQLATLSSIPVVIAPAAGAGLGYIVVSVSVAVSQTVVGNSGTWRIQLSGVPGIDTVTNIPNDLNNVRNKVFHRAGSDIGATGANVTNMRNKPLIFIADADPASAGDAVAVVTVIYSTIAWPT